MLLKEKFLQYFEEENKQIRKVDKRKNRSLKGSLIALEYMKPMPTWPSC